MNREYLKDGIRLMKEVEAKQLPFNMNNWFSTGVAECGSAACFLGHCALDDKFKERGLEIVHTKYGDAPSYKGHGPVCTAAELFDITRQEAAYLIFPDRYSCEGDYPGLDLGSKPSYRRLRQAGALLLRNWIRLSNCVRFPALVGGIVLGCNLANLPMASAGVIFVKGVNAPVLERVRNSYTDAVFIPLWHRSGFSDCHDFRGSRPLTRNPELVGGPFEGPGKTSDGDGGDRSHESIVPVNENYDPKKNVWAEMVLGALFYVSVLIGVAYVAIHWSEK